jgi:predicted kinase
VKTAIISIGLPGSGKTTLLKKMAAQDGAVYICPDDIRAEEAFGGDAADQSRNREVWTEAYRRIDAALSAGRNVVIDATNAKQPDRRRLVAHCRQKADQVKGVWFNTPYRVCLERNRGRVRVVPEFTMGIMAGWLEACPPTEADGFDQLVVLDPFKH